MLREVCVFIHPLKNLKTFEKVLYKICSCYFFLIINLFDYKLFNFLTFL